MSRRPLRIATTGQLERSVREAGFDAYLLPELPDMDFNRSIAQRREDGKVFYPFLEKHDIDLVVDFNTAALTLIDSPSSPDNAVLTTAALGIPFVSCYLDPVTSTMSQLSWADHWHLLESDTWIKWIWESAHADELMRMGIPNVVTMPMAMANADFDTSSPDVRDGNPVVAFMGHPATTWFQSDQSIKPYQMFVGMTAAAVHADMPDLPFHKIFYDLHEFAALPQPSDDRQTRARMSQEYFAQKFTYNAYLAIKQRDRFVRFLQRKIGDCFEIIGDHWSQTYGLHHTPRIWDMDELHRRMRNVPVCLNLMKGCLETGMNIRHFEIPAHGGFMLTYASPELSTCFEVGKECDSFRSEAELLEKIQYYIDHPDHRREIAAAGQRRVLTDHLYSHRIKTLVELLEKASVLPKRGIRQEECGMSPAQELDTVNP